jgi:aminoglycoside phosphotransferase (APT) family kinase protein
MGGELIETECRLLPYLANRLTLPIPNPIYIGSPEGDYPYSFAGYRHLAGTPACHLSWTGEERSKNASKIGEFLKSLHETPVTDEDKTWAPGDTIGRSNLALRHQHNIQRVNELCHEGENQLAGHDPEQILDLSEELSQTPPYDGPKRWVHGDAYACHYLADQDHNVCGVIDWGDAHLGDPALDISIAFGFLPAGARDEFRAAYGGPDEDTWRRAQFRALHYGLLFVKYGAESGKPYMKQLGLDSLRLALA